MKNRILYTVLFALILTFGTPQAILWCKKTVMNQATIHKAAQNEYLSKISLQYYGTPKYWRDLAIINRTPFSDLLYTGEEIFIPGKTTMEDMYQARLRTEQAYQTNKSHLPQPPEKQVMTNQSGNNLYQVSNDSLPDLIYFVEKPGVSDEKELALPIIFAGFGGLLIGTLMLGFISQKSKR